jgi:uncharacterized YigZ family protein
MGNQKEFYKQITQSYESQINIKNSKFIAIALPVFNEKEAKLKVKKIKETYIDAGHHCYAYAINTNPTIYKWSDDGEPNNTAGRPILRQLLAFDLTNTLVVVVRYFGGKLLGVPGLIEAYGTAAKLSLELCPTEIKQVTLLFTISFEFEHEGMAWQLCNKSAALVRQTYYNDKKGFIDISIPINQKEAFLSIAASFHVLTLKTQ